MNTQVNQNSHGQGRRFGSAQAPHSGISSHGEANSMFSAPQKLDIFLPPCAPRDFRHPKDKFLAGILMAMAPAWGYFYLGDVLKGWIFLGAQLVLLLFLTASFAAGSAFAIVFGTLYGVLNLLGLLLAILIWGMSLERWDKSYGFRV